MSNQDVYEISEILKHYLVETKNCQIKQVCKRLDTDMNLKMGTSLTLLRRLIAHKQIAVNMTLPLSGTSLVNVVKSVKFLEGGNIDYATRNN